MSLLFGRLTQRRLEVTFVISAAVCAAVTVLVLNFLSQESNGTSMRIAFNHHTEAATLDPGRILTASEYLLVDNLYGRLVERDDDGQLVPGLAERFSWQGEDLVFEFSEKARTAAGDLIGAEDASLSLKRAMILGKTGHGDLRLFLCPNEQVNSVRDECKGIRVEGNRLILTPYNRTVGLNLLTALESADFGIIPRSSLDFSTRVPTITNFRNTSGPYFVAKDSARGAFELEANKNHYRYSPEMPNHVVLVPSTVFEGVDKLINGEVDLIPTTMMVPQDAITRAREKLGSVQVHETIPIRVVLLCFTPLAVREFSPEHRVFVGRAMQEFFTQAFPSSGSKPTSEFFQALSEGSLNGKQLSEISLIRSSHERPIFHRPMRMGVGAGSLKKFQDGLSGYEEIEFVMSDKSYLKIPSSERFDFYLISTDSAWTESFSLLANNFEVEVFHSPGLDSNAWLTDFVNTSLKSERIEKLTELHYSLLKNVVIFPIAVTPYFAISNQKWRLNQSTLSARTELWKIRTAP